MHAPLFDPGGVPSTRHSASGTAAFQCLETVGFPPRYTFRGSITRPASSLPPAPYSHCWVCTWRLLLTCWRDFSQGGLALRSAHLLGNINQFHRIAPIPKVSGLPWRDQAYVRQLEQDYDVPGAEAPHPRREDDFNPEQLMHELEDFLRQEREGRGD
jgi:hypothetical protein